MISPPHLADFAAADWIDEFHWRLERWAWYKAHPELAEVVDPIAELVERRRARLEAP